MPVDSHRISLLPQAVKANQRGRQNVKLAGVGVVVFLVLLGFLWFQKGQQVSAVKADVATQRATNTKLQAEIRKLDYIEAKNKAVAEKEALVTASWAGEVSWYRLLQDVATTMPSQNWLTSFQAQSAAPSAAAPAVKAVPASSAPSVQIAGQFTVSGKGFDHPDSADWLARIAQMREVANLWLTQSTLEGTAADLQQTTSFSSSGELTSEAWSSRAKKAAKGSLYEGTNAQ